MQVEISANKEKWSQAYAQKQIKHGFFKTTVNVSKINHQLHQRRASADETKKKTFSEEIRLQFVKRDVLTRNDTDKTTKAKKKFGKLSNDSSKIYKGDKINTIENMESIEDNHDHDLKK